MTRQTDLAKATLLYLRHSCDSTLRGTQPGNLQADACKKSNMDDPTQVFAGTDIAHLPKLAPHPQGEQIQVWEQVETLAVSTSMVCKTTSRPLAAHERNSMTGYLRVQSILAPQLQRKPAGQPYAYRSEFACHQEDETSNAQAQKLES